MKSFISCLVVGCAVALTGCAGMTHDLGLKKGYQDSKDFQAGKDIKEGYGIGYVRGWKEALKPEDLAAQKAKEEELKKQMEAKRANIESLLGK